MSLSRVLSSIQQAVLSHGRISPAAFPLSPLQIAVQRWYASGYLDRNQVTDRILSNVKNFEKVDANKVLATSLLLISAVKPVSEKGWLSEATPKSSDMLVPQTLPGKP